MLQDEYTNKESIFVAVAMNILYSVLEKVQQDSSSLKFDNSLKLTEISSLVHLQHKKNNLKYKRKTQLLLTTLSWWKCHVE